MTGLSATMRAAVWTGEDDRLRLETIPVPTPRTGEALVRVAACGVCHTDLHVMRREVAFPSPAVLGHELSGTVVAIGGDGGPRAGHVTVGDRVVGAFVMPCGSCRACERGRDDMCSKFFGMNRIAGVLYDGTTRLHRADGTSLAMYSMGALAEYAVVPVTALTRLPDALPLESAAILGCAAFTAYGAVRHAGEVAPGDSVAVVAVGGVGSNIVQLARAAGADPVIAVDVGPEKLTAALGWGATHVVDAGANDLVAAVREITGGVGVDVAFEALGSSRTFEQAVGMLADGGRMVAVGIAPGAAAAQIAITPLVRRGQRIVGSFGGRTRTDLPALVALAVGGTPDVAALVTRRFALDEVDQAFRLLADGGIRGRAVVTMGEAGSA
ncbi:zinc-binding dehydrogenase [Pseudolysinimonas sp.]|uniref:zinc-binding dehydrogenase n=1 Tax=Pseudolysinimonas sp. TaxID=2680009 RepID=UPI003F802B51